MTIENKQNAGVGNRGFTFNEIMDNNADIFQKPSFDSLIQEKTQISFAANNLDSETGPYHIRIPSNHLQYIEANATHLQVVFSVVKQDGTNLDNDTNVSIVNFPGASLFKTIRVGINGKQVSELTNEHFPYKNYMENVLSVDQDALATVGKSEQCYLDSPWNFNTLDEANKGFNSRKTLIQGSKKVDAYIPLNVDFFMSDKLIPPNTSLSLGLDRSSDRYVLMSDDEVNDFKVKIHDMRVYVTYVTLNPSVHGLHKAMYDRGEKSFHPFSKTEIYTKQFNPGHSTLQVNNLTTGTIPRQIVIGLTDRTAVDGSLRKNPFNFWHFFVKRVELKINGQPFPREPLTPDFTNSLVTRAYKHLLTNTGADQPSSGSVITKKMFQGGYTFYVMDLSQDQSNGYHRYKSRQGNVDLNLDLDGPLDCNVTLVCALIYDDCLTFDKDRNFEVFRL